MRNIRLKISALVLTIVIMITAFPACQKPTLAVDSYIAILPEILHSGRVESISISLLNGDKLVEDDIEISLFKDSKKVVSSSQTIDGSGIINLDIPQNTEEGEYEIEIKGSVFSDKASVNVTGDFLVFVETDKPI